MMRSLGSAFSLLELVLAIGILAIIFPLTGVLFYSQFGAQYGHKVHIEQLDIIHDFYAYTQVQDFEHIKRLAKQKEPIYVIDNEQDSIIVRKFVDYDTWARTNEREREYYTIRIDQIGKLFSDENVATRPYVPLICKLSKISPNNTEKACTSFTAIKVY